MIALGTPAASRAIQKMTDELAEEDRQERRGLAPLTHRCGRCSKEATYLDRAHSGAVCYCCRHCDPRGWPTIVQFGPFNHPMRRVGDR